MWFAIVTVCSLTSNDCALVRDDWGPYSTVDACEERLHKMTPGVKVYFRVRFPADDWHVEGMCRQEDDI